MKEELSISALPLSGGDFYLVDVRDEEAFGYGHVNGAVNIPAEKLCGADLPKDKPLILYCRNGSVSPQIAEALQKDGYNARYLAGGYAGWIKSCAENLSCEETAKRAEDSIRKKYHKQLFTKFAKAIVEYGLIEPDDKIAVCISGGKDSFLMAKLFQEIKRHNKVPFSLEFLVMDPGYSKENGELIERNAKLLNIPVTVFKSDIFESVFNIEKSPCYICARMRRGYLYSKAKSLGCNKIALGHHYDDVIETILMGMLYGGQVQTMMPKLKSTNFEGMELIRPMYFIREEDIKAWRDYNGLHFLQCACKFTEECATRNSGISKRQKVKELIRRLESEDKGIEQNIFKSVENVSLSTVIAYKDKEGNRHRFTDDY